MVYYLFSKFIACIICILFILLCIQNSSPASIPVFRLRQARERLADIIGLGSKFKYVLCVSFLLESAMRIGMDGLFFLNINEMKTSQMTAIIYFIYYRLYIFYVCYIVAYNDNE